MNNRAKYSALMLVALCFLITPLHSNAKSGKDTPSVTQVVLPTFKEDVRLAKASTYTIAPENCTLLDGPITLKTVSDKTQATYGHRDTSSWGNYFGFQFGPSTLEYIAGLTPSGRLTVNRGCNLHLPDGTKISAIRVHTQMNEQSTIRVEIRERSVQISADDDLYSTGMDPTTICGFMIDKENWQSNKTHYSKACNAVIDNKNNSYSVLIQLVSAPAPEGVPTYKKFPAKIRAVQIDYYPPK